MRADKVRVPISTLKRQVLLGCLAGFSPYFIASVIDASVKSTRGLMDEVRDEHGADSLPRLRFVMLTHFLRD